MTAVVHLVWGPLGVTPLREFLASYRQHDAGAHHELVVVFNGVRDEQRRGLLAELEGTSHTLLELKRPVQDLAAYRQAAAQIDHGHVCFLNSYSVVLQPGWLRILEGALAEPDVGLAGASGSWASFGSLALNALGLPSAYRRVGLTAASAEKQLRSIASERESEGPSNSERASSRARSVLARTHALPASVGQVVRFGGFPNHHLRTNAFMVEREVFVNLPMGRLASKSQAYVLESGRKGLTRMVERLGLRVLIADRRGATYEKDSWPESSTLWQRDQEGLLIADNQTRMYAEATAERRRFLSALAWGERAEPQTGRRMPAGA